MIQLKRNISGVSTVLGLSLLASCSYAKAGINVYVKNNCNSLQYVEQRVDGIAKTTKEILAYQRLMLDYVDTGYYAYNSNVDYFIYEDKPKQQLLGSVNLALHNYWSKNEYFATASNVNIDIDLAHRSWHNWAGTPNITFELCPNKAFEISKDSLFDGVNRVVIFGDSLSDEGNLFALTQGVIPSSRNYYNGMFSNGNTWSAIFRNALLQHNIKVSNYAVGGATTLSYDDNLHLPYTLTDETHMYYANALYENWQDANSTLVVIWIGGNDYLTQPNNLDEKSQQQLTTNVVDTIKATIEELAASGVKKFVVFNLPNLSYVPASVSINKNTAVTEALSKQHNDKLKTMIASLIATYSNEHVFKEMDIADLFGQFMEKSQRQQLNGQYKLKVDVVNKPCYQGNYAWLNMDLIKAVYNAYTEQVIPGLVSLKNIMYDAYKYFNVCNNPEAYFFYDQTHPSAQVHEVIYDKFVKNT